MDAAVVPLSRADLAYEHSQRALKQRASEWMCRYTKVLERGQFEEAADALVMARSHYVDANEQEAADDIDAMLMRVRGDQTLDLIQKARDKCEYDECVVLCKDALKHYKVLAGLTTLRRETSATEIERREQDKERYVREESDCLLFV